MQAAQRTFLLLWAYGVATLPLVLWGATGALDPHANLPSQWIPSTHPVRVTYDEFRDSFGSDDAVIFSWTGCKIDEPKLDQLLKSLRHASAFHDNEKNWYFERVACGREIVQQLMAPPFNLTKAAAVARLRGTLVGPDEQTTSVIVTFTPAGVEQREVLLANIAAAAQKFCDVSPDDVHFAGPIVDGATTDRYSRASLERFAVPSAVVLFLLCWHSLRSLRAAILVFLMSVYCQALTLSLVHYCGDSLSALLTVLPPLIQVLAIAGGIHFINYYFDSLDHLDHTHAAAEAFRIGWLPFVLCTGTTAIGLGSLLMSELQPIRAFGAYSAVGVLAMTGLLLAFVPGILSVWPIIPRKRTNDSHHDSTHTKWQPLATFVTKFHAPIVAVATVAMLGLGWGIKHLHTSVRIETLFHPDSRIIKDYRWLEDHVAKLVPIEVLLKFDRDSVSLSGRLRLLTHVDRELKNVSEVHGTLTPITFLPELPPVDNIPPEMVPQVFEQALVAARPNWTAIKRRDDLRGVETFRLTAYVSALSPLNYGGFVDTILERVQSSLHDSRNQPLAGVSVQCTGAMPLVHEVQNELFSALRSSFLSALVVITAIMTLAQSGFWTGLIAMVSNIFPSLILFGALGWRGTSVDIGSILTASIALGMAVDDTFHFLTFFRRGLNQGLTRRVAVKETYERCGSAIIQTSVTCAAGLSVFALSDFAPAAQFAWMMVALIMLALLGDIVVLPALLIGPLGSLFLTAAQSVESNAHVVLRPPHVRKSEIPSTTPSHEFLH